MCVISHCWCIFYVLQRFFPNFTEKPYWIFLMKKVIIITYWVIAVLLISLIVLSLGYRFSESLFIGAVFLPGAFFSIYFPERISRQGSLKDMLYVITGTLVAEIFLILSAHFVIHLVRREAVNEVRGDSVYVTGGAVLPLSRGYKDRAVGELLTDAAHHG